MIDYAEQMYPEMETGVLIFGAVGDVTNLNCDMIIMYDDIGCKGMAGAQGLIEEEIRKHDERFHTVWMPHSLMDHRIVSPAEARRTVNEYMINVMHEEPVDPSLLDFDDSMGW